MALDHSATSSAISLRAEDIDKTWTFYFLVRWVTHFCAPAFFLLAGVGAYLYGASIRQRPAMVSCDPRGLARGAGVHAHRFAWTSIPLGHVRSHLLPWTFHDSVGAFVRLPRVLGLSVALAVIATHDLFDGLKPAAFHSGRWLLFMLHRSAVPTGRGTALLLFPLIPGAP